ncbi:Squamosa promoter-binding-like protein 9 [Rhynchospora pubera]|uniref:Squamosa promoter-binding-like protein 9 n=1 Tax=Rhynchospora pubera TaxID=906938 RepID=A0AAV8EXT7_9POAL|nr:Squamosa promoter-binding-like protein 9 [Rhynchospora pubera]
MEDPSFSADDPTSLWDWDNLLNFPLNPDEISDEHLNLPWSDGLQSGDHPPQPIDKPSPASPPPATLVEELGKVRKRDPRLICPNYLAGRVPCACPELDEKAAEEDEVVEIMAGARKRVRKGGSGVQIEIRCQVPGCEADIKELKGYHRRHRVCLRCANATCVVLEGEQKRYCQQCGKFHLLSDFDEGKRSCRRKLERHNKRRRRRPDSKHEPEREMEDQVDILTDLTCDGQPGGETSHGVGSETVLSNKSFDKETPTGSDEGTASPNCTLPNMPNEQSNSVISFMANGEASEEQKLDNTKPLHSSLAYDNRSVYSSSCPTGRISFKLYDWNPAEFPRRLRHQIFEWLASMPVELEGYIRPGCTILTLFIAMPQIVWDKLSRDAATIVKDLVDAPGSMLVGRGTFFIQLDNAIIQILKDGTSMMNIRMEVHAPRIHYVHPTYFEVGKPIEFVVCGSYLNQHKFRSLVSFNGKYVKHKCSQVGYKPKDDQAHRNEEDYFSSSDHEMLKINITQAEMEIHGPAFIEVENVSGLSNFVPVIFGSKQICTELAKIQEKALSTTPVRHSHLCEYFVSRQNAISQLLLEIAWLQRKPNSDEYTNKLNTVNIQRLTCLLRFLVANDLVNLLEIVLCSLKNLFGSEVLSDLERDRNGSDVAEFLDLVDHAKECLGCAAKDGVAPDLGLSKCTNPDDDSRLSTACTNQEEDASREDEQCSPSTSYTEDEGVVLLQRETARGNYYNSQMGRTWSVAYPGGFTRARFAAFVMVAVLVCVCACIVLFHPHKSRSFAMSVRRCMYWNSAS